MKTVIYQPNSNNRESYLMNNKFYEFSKDMNFSIYACKVHRPQTKGKVEALAKANDMYDSQEFTSSLLTGAAWDRTLSWLEETVTISEIIVDSKSWGNYSDDTFSGTTGLINTGIYNQTMKNNIYDLAGNLFEWTTEATNTVNRVIRGRFLQHCGF